MKRTGLPAKDELVICRITKIYPNSAFAEMIEYGKSGMIHISEVASRWVKDIKTYLKENQHVVCKVLVAQEGHIELSIKRVSREQTSSRLNEFKREKKAEKLLEFASKSVKVSLDKAYEEVGSRILEEFGSLTKAFDVALKNPELLKARGIPQKWADALIEIAVKSSVEKTFKVKADLELISYEPGGINIIKKALSGVKDKDIEIRYVSAPAYSVIGKGNKYREVEAKVRSACEDIVKSMKGHGEASFKMEK